jgi:hypothetical protein
MVIMEDKVYLDYSEYRTGGEPDDPGDRWTSHSDEYVEFTPTALRLKQSENSWINETIDVNFSPKLDQEVTLVIVRYETGSTFGRIIGVWQIIGVFADRQNAEKARGLIAKYNSSNGCKKFEEKMAKLTGHKYFYPSWVGYFERFIETEIHSMRLQ